MRTRGLIGLTGLALLSVGLALTVAWPVGLVAFGLGLYADTLMGRRA